MVVIKLDLLALVVPGMTIGTIARTPLPAPDVVLRRPFDVVRHDQIKVPVLVVVKPAGARGPSAFIGNACLRRHVGKGSVAVVVIEDRAVVAGDIEIGIAIVIEVAHRYALPV